MKRLIIEQLKVGLIFIDENDEKYAISDTMLSLKVKAYFGLTSHKPKKNIAPPAKVSEGRPETQGNKTPDSPILSETKLGTPDNILQPRDLKLAAFDYRGWSPKKYKSLSIWELPDGKVVLEYAHSRYYTSKSEVMRIPFPFPKGYFSTENGWSSSVEQAFKMYRRYLAEWKEPEGQTDGTCDDVSFDTCANNDPKICKFCINESRYEDKRKLAARKPGAPLLKASMGV